MSNKYDAVLLQILAGLSIYLIFVLSQRRPYLLLVKIEYLNDILW